jgi:hypothetical protein
MEQLRHLPVSASHPSRALVQRWTARLAAGEQIVRFEASRQSFVEVCANAIKWTLSTSHLRPPCAQVSTNKRLKGITSHLRAAFFPEYSLRSAAHGPALAPRTSARRPSGPTGIERGSRVDAEITAAVNKVVRPRHPYARRIMAALAKAEFIPLRSQVGGGGSAPYDPRPKVFLGID